MMCEGCVKDVLFLEHPPLFLLLLLLTTFLSGTQTRLFPSEGCARSGMELKDVRRMCEE